MNYFVFILLLLICVLLPFFFIRKEGLEEELETKKTEIGNTSQVIIDNIKLLDKKLTLVEENVSKIKPLYVEYSQSIRLKKAREDVSGNDTPYVQTGNMYNKECIPILQKLMNEHPSVDNQKELMSVFYGIFNNMYNIVTNYHEIYRISRRIENDMINLFSLENEVYTRFSYSRNKGLNILEHIKINIYSTNSRYINPIRSLLDKTDKNDIAWEDVIQKTLNKMIGILNVNPNPDNPQMISFLNTCIKYNRESQSSAIHSKYDYLNTLNTEYNKLIDLELNSPTNTLSYNLELITLNINSLKRMLKAYESFNNERFEIMNEINKQYNLEIMSQITEQDYQFYPFHIGVLTLYTFISKYFMYNCLFESKIKTDRFLIESDLRKYTDYSLGHYSHALYALKSAKKNEANASAAADNAAASDSKKLSNTYATIAYNEYIDASLNYMTVDTKIKELNQIIVVLNSYDKYPEMLSHHVPPIPNPMSWLTTEINNATATAETFAKNAYNSYISSKASADSKPPDSGQPIPTTPAYMSTTSTLANYDQTIRTTPSYMPTTSTLADSGQPIFTPPSYMPTTSTLADSDQPISTPPHVISTFVFNTKFSMNTY